MELIVTSALAKITLEYNIEENMNNDNLLRYVTESFYKFIDVGNSRCTAKLDPLHGGIAKDLSSLIGNNYTVHSKGWGDGKEIKVQGRYYPKNVDVTIKNSEGDVVAGIAVKFVMQTYSKNSINYFENMMGETGNLRKNNIPYFQVFIILDEIPCYKNDGTIKHWEVFSEHNNEKYVALSYDDPETDKDVPNKTLMFIVHVKTDDVKTRDDYLSYHNFNKSELELTNYTYSEYGDAVILNDYEKFLNSIVTNLYNREQMKG
ncbi:MAG: hypothetical protein J6R59_01200 [Paludibacteraceae bacterium]|nr:hypothetical protein [Paludibacteraceae bacterium]